MKYLFVGLVLWLAVSAPLLVFLVAQLDLSKLLNQKLQEKFDQLSLRYVNLDWELKQLRSQLGRLEYQQSLLKSENQQLKEKLVPPPQFEFQKWSSPYPEPQVGSGSIVSPQDSSQQVWLAQE